MNSDFPTKISKDFPSGSEKGKALIHSGYIWVQFCEKERHALREKIYINNSSSINIF